MYSITDLKKDTLIDLDGQPYRVTDYMQKQMGRGGSIVNVKLKNLQTGATLDKTFKGNDKIQPADISRSTVQFLYAAAEKRSFMDTASYETIDIEASLIGKPAEFLAEGMECQALLFKGQIISVELPIKVELKVTTAPEVTRGDTQSTVMKNIELENGTEIMAPIFIKQGDTIVVDTRDGSYVERVKA